MEYAFITLYEKNALTRLQLVEDLPAEAMAEYLRIKRSIGTATAHGTAPAAAQAAQAPLAPVVTETPVERAARDWTELDSSAFAKKYLNHQGNRKFYEQALAEGLIK
jgi:hypothetical protein